MKSFTGIFPKICALENLYQAAGKARKRKTRKEYVEAFGLRRERIIGQLHEELLTGTYEPSGYRQFRIFEPRERLISAAPYRDRVVHHAICTVLEPILSRRFIFDSYSCQKGKGTGFGRERARKFTNRYRYVLKGDVRKFFQSMDHRVLLEKLGRVIRCQPTLTLCGKVIESHFDDELDPQYFPGDELFCPSHRLRGLPIGNLTSQLWANFYLDGMDHMICEKLRVPAYSRYTDDFLIWSDDKGFLQDCRERIRQRLAEDRLVLHPVKTRVMPTSSGVPFLGFRFFPGRAPRLLGEVKRRFERRTRRQVAEWREGRLNYESLHSSVEGWRCFAAYGNTSGLFNAYRKNGF
jgi:RNA-directed DNA polymerase